MIFKSMTAAAAIVAGFAMASAATAAPVIKTTFEAQGAASPGTYCYFLGNYAGACAAGSVTGGGNTSGLQLETNTAWPGTPTPDGRYYAFIQSGYGAPGSFSQNITLASGNYRFAWLDAGRNGSTQTYDVTLSNGLGSTTLHTGTTMPGQLFTAVNAGVFNNLSGNYTLTFAARNSGGDNSSFIDRITVTAVPEPAVWGMMIMGFGLIGATMRRRSSKLALA